MCGIAGLVGTTPLGESERAAVWRMCQVMRHRGPDDEGFYFADGVGLGARRLSIIDLETGGQPLYNEDRSVVVVLNGEIYNYRELRRQLEERGHRFTSRSDTETIAHLYEEHGEDCVRYLRGMFAFALWDARRRRLLLARDRLGIKPLYYAERRGRLVFGSEVKCLLEVEDVSPRVRPSALAAYLTLSYVPAPGTMLEGVFELPAGHTLSWTDGRWGTSRYWRLQPRRVEVRTEQEAVEGFLEKLRESVRLHLVADVPVAAFLSGGLDSGILVALMAEESTGPVETFTVGLDGPDGRVDERADARLVAERYGTRHRELVARPEVGRVLLELVHAFDQPHGDSSALPHYWISAEASRRVKVAISGLGGDELAAGYERYIGGLLGQRLGRVPGWVWAVLARAAGLLGDWGADRRVSAHRLRRLLSSFRHSDAAAYLELLATFGPAELETLLVPGWDEGSGSWRATRWLEELFEESGSDHLLDRMLYADAYGYLVGDLLALADRTSMWHSLELRVPYLDHELFEYAAGLPPRLKVRGLRGKHLLRAVAKRVLPEPLLRRRKRGFSVPLARWLRGELRPLVHEWLSERRVREQGLLRSSVVSRLVEEHTARRANHENKLWSLLMLAIWYERYLVPGRLSREDLALRLANDRAGRG